MGNKQSNQDRSEELLRMALEDHVIQTESELKKKDELQKSDKLHQFSPEFEKRFEGMLRKSKLEKKKRERRRLFTRIAACFLLVVGVGAITVASVDAIRIPFMSFLLSIGQESGEMVGNAGNNMSISTNYISSFPTYIPNGFIMVAHAEYDNGYSVSYQSESKEYFQLDCYESSKTFSFDAEDSDVEEITIQNSKAAVSSRDGRVVITWPAVDYNYILAGNITKDVAIDILNSVHFD